MMSNSDDRSAGPASGYVPRFFVKQKITAMVNRLGEVFLEPYSLLRSTWHLHYNDVDARGQERSMATAIIRRFVDIPLRFHFDFVDVASGELVLAVERQRSLRDRYEVNVADPRLDVRVAAAMTVALDAFQGR